MVNDMEYEIVQFLENDNYDALSSNYALYSFQAQMLCFMYNSAHSDILKNKIVKDIISGRHTTAEDVKNMFKTYIEKAVKYSNDNGLSILMEKCKLSEEDARGFIRNYLNAIKNLNEALSAELDVGNINIRMNEMIEELLPAFLESEKGIVL
jgi:hypothetical protein